MYQLTYPLLLWSIGNLLLRAPVETETCETDSGLRPLARKVLKVLLVPPVIGVFSGLIVASVPHARGLLVDLKKFDDDSPLEWLFNAVVAMGNAAVPVNMLILGSSLANIPSFSSIHWRSTMAVAFSKLVVHPALGCGILFGLHSSGTLRHLVGDSMRPEFVILACILCATPTANNITVLAETSAGKEAKTALASMIFVQYCLTPLTLTGWVLAGLALAKAEAAPEDLLSPETASAKLFLQPREAWVL